jgi:hypothetical protein
LIVACTGSFDGMNERTPVLHRTGVPLFALPSTQKIKTTLRQDFQICKQKVKDTAELLRS